MPPRAVWKGSLQFGELICPVSLFTAVSTSERIAFHTINRKTGHRVHRQFLDSETGKPVDQSDQVKGYDKGSGDYVILEPDEIAQAAPQGDKTLAVQTFVACDAIDTIFFDRPYYLTPSDSIGQPAFALLKEGLRTKKVVALGTAMLFRRVRTVLIRVHDDSVIATLLKFNYEVRSGEQVFDDVPDIEIKSEMVDLATHIIKTKMGKFDPKSFDDRYEDAVAEMVRAKIEGRPLKARPAPAVSKPVDLMAALRESAKAQGKPRKAPVSSRKQTGSRTARPSSKQPARRAS